jgi:ferredoxin
MKVFIEKEFCTACGICYETYTSIFIEGEDGISDINPDLKGKSLEGQLAKEAISAAEECPAGAIVVR